jgi:hypothetical protein
MSRIACVAAVVAPDAAFGVTVESAGIDERSGVGIFELSWIVLSGGPGSDAPHIFSDSMTIV